MWYTDYVTSASKEGVFYVELASKWGFCYVNRKGGRKWQKGLVRTVVVDL